MHMSMNLCNIKWHYDWIRFPFQLLTFYVLYTFWIYLMYNMAQIMIIDFKLTYPSGTATAHLINSFHTPQGAKLAKWGHDTPHQNTFLCNLFHKHINLVITIFYRYFIIENKWEHWASSSPLAFFGVSSNGSSLQVMTVDL